MSDSPFFSTCYSTIWIYTIDLKDKCNGKYYFKKLGQLTSMI